MNNNDKALITGGHELDIGVTSAKRNNGATENTDSNSMPKRGARTDQDQLHITHHNILSRHPHEALVKAGENSRELRRHERALLAELQPQGIVAQCLFDHCLSSSLKCLLSNRAEKNLFEAQNRPSEERLREANKIALAGGQPKNDNDFFKNLSIIQRYDSHHSRQFFKTLAVLLALRGTGQAGLARVLGKAFAQGKDATEETDQ
jgi:hypothetical protein